MENNSQSATLQKSPALFPPDAFDPLVSLLTLVTVLVVAIAVSLFIVLYAVGHGFTTIAGAGRWASIGLPGVLTSAGGEIAAAFFLLWILPKVAKVPLRTLGFVSPSGADFRVALIGAVAMVVLTNGSASLLETAFHIKVSEQAITLFLSLKTPAAKLTFAALGIVIAPIAEETVFRVFAFNALRKYGRFWTAAVLSGLLFGFAHFQPGLSLFQTGVLTLPLALGGVILAIVYAKTGNAYASMITHGVFNSVTMVILFVAPHLAQ